MIPEIVIAASGSGSNFERLVLASREGTLRAKVRALVVDRSCAAVERAERLGVECFKLSKPWDLEFERIVDSLSPDLIVLAGFMRIIPERLVSKYFPKIVNIHPSLLPSFPGKNGIAQAYDYGVKITGITVHLVDAGIDTGPIVFQKALEVEDSWDVERLEAEIHKLEHEHYPRVVDSLLHRAFEVDGRKFRWVAVEP